MAIVLDRLCVLTVSVKNTVKASSYGPIFAAAQLRWIFFFCHEPGVGVVYWDLCLELWGVPDTKYKNLSDTLVYSTYSEEKCQFIIRIYKQTQGKK